MKALVIFALCSCFTLSSIAQSTTKTAARNSEFNQMLQNARANGLESLSSENFSESTFKDMFANTDNSFSTAQVRKILSVIAKDSGKLALARVLYNKVTDPANFGSLSDLFKSSTYSSEFVLWVHQADNESGVPISNIMQDDEIYAVS